MSKSIRIRKGLDIRLKGEADKSILDAQKSDIYAINPPNFHGVVPKMLVKTGDTVKIGTPIFKDKYQESVMYVSPVSGEVLDIVRGAKRRILSITIKNDGQFSSEEHGSLNLSSMSGEEVKNKLLAAGLWPFIKQRPIDIVANPNNKPKAIFISAVDSSPLGVDFDFILNDRKDDLQAGIDALKKLTEGKVHVTSRTNNGVFASINGIEKNTVTGPHPAGNVGVHIHHIDPINSGEFVWVVGAQDVATIGSFFRTGKFNSEKTIALAGSEVSTPRYFKTRIGAQISSITTGNVNSDNPRYISGNVMTGETVKTEDFLGFYDNQVTVLPEGDHYKFMLTEGWLSLGFNKFSMSRVYPTWLTPKSKKYKLDTNLNGEKRAFVVTGQYEQVFPFDIYPVQLLKAMIVNDIDSMEKLGVYEIAPEDFALCEFVCTSKINSQEIVREGLDLIQKECM